MMELIESCRSVAAGFREIADEAGSLNWRRSQSLLLTFVFHFSWIMLRQRTG